jgi:hypothetical protein
MIELKDIEGSTQVAAAGHDAAQRVLAIRYGNGKVYHYRDIPQEVVDAFFAAESKGKFLARHIRGFYDFEPVADEPAETEPAAE